MTMKLFYCDHFVLPLPAGHRFPMIKYARLRESLEASGRFRPDDFAEPPAISLDDLNRAHDPAYVARAVSGQLDPAEIRRIGFPWSAQMVERSRRSAGATLAACEHALQHGCAANLAGGTHHAMADAGAGFCVFNDGAIAARSLLARRAVERIAIIDCDVHQGDGTAAMLADEPRAYTLSLHGSSNFPFRKQHSRHDIGLPDGCDDDTYLTELTPALTRLFEYHRPHLVIYLAGADPYVGDRLGRLALTEDGLAERDRRVLGACWHAGVPVVLTMGGGYAEPIDDTVRIHARTVLTAADIYRHPPRCH